MLCDYLFICRTLLNKKPATANVPDSRHIPSVFEREDEDKQIGIHTI